MRQARLAAGMALVFCITDPAPHNAQHFVTSRRGLWGERAGRELGAQAVKVATEVDKVQGAPAQEEGPKAQPPRDLPSLALTKGDAVDPDLSMHGGKVRSRAWSLDSGSSRVKVSLGEGGKRRERKGKRCCCDTAHANKNNPLLGRFNRPNC